MQQLQSEMPPMQRLFSKFIHIRMVEKLSDFLSVTLARPNALLSGAVGTFILTLTAYLWARHEGYPLSGFEATGAFIVGWVLGMLFDFFRTMITGKR